MLKLENPKILPQKKFANSGRISTIAKYWKSLFKRWNFLFKMDKLQW